MPKDAYYFSHDSNAHTDPRILKLRMALGWEGYGIYWAIIENLRNQENYCICESEFMFLTLSLAIDEAKLKQMLSKCLEVKLLELEEGKIFSPSLLRRMEKSDTIREKRREAGAKGGKAKASAKQVLKQSSSKNLALKETKVKEKKVNKTKPKAFVAPTFEVYSAYCKQEGFLNIAERSFKAYSESDWHDSHGNPVKNWKSKLQNNWFRDQNKDSNQPQQKSINDCFGA